MEWKDYIESVIERGVSREQIRQRLDVSQSAISRWLGGIASPPKQTQNEIRKILDAMR